MIDGDSFAHRSYHALPKTIRRSDGKPAGTILGFVNFLLRLYADEQPRAIVVGWDTLDAPTKRREMFPAASERARVDDDVMSNSRLPESPGLDLRTPKPQGSKQTTFSPPRSPLRSVRAALHWWRAAIGIPFSSPRRALRSSTRRVAGSSRVSAPKRSGNDMASSQTKCPTSLRSAGTFRTNCPALPESGQNAPLSWCNGMERLMASSKPVSFQTQAKMLRLYRLIATMDAKAPVPSLADQEPRWVSASTFARDWGLNQLADRLDRMA